MSEPIFNIHDTLLIATAFQSLLFVLLIMLVKHDRHQSDYFLVGFFLAQIAIPLHILINYGEVFKFIALEASPNLFHLFDIAHWLEGPLLLWYTRALLYKNFKLGRVDVLFLVPTLFYILYIIATFYSQDTQTKIEIIAAHQNAVTATGQHWIEAIREAFRVFFSVLCLIDIRHAQQQIRERYSSIEKIDFGWLRFLVVAFMVLRVWILIVVLISILAPGLADSVFNFMGLAGNYMMFAMMSTLIFFSLTRSTIIEGDTPKESANADHHEIEIDPELTRKIEQHMINEKPYLSHFLNLEQLANQLSMHPRTLSQTIKNHFNTNFYEFVNSYRIEEAKAILENPEQRDKTMIDILGECGFNSKATYNTFFKKLEGSTPTQYRKAKLKANKVLV